MLSRAYLHAGLCRSLATSLCRAPAALATSSRGVATQKGDINTPTSLEVVPHAAVAPEDYVRLNPADYFSDFEDSSVLAELGRLRAIEDEAIAVITQEVAPIDWDEWKKEIRYPGLVDELKAVHDAVPMPDVEKERERLVAVVRSAFEPVLATLKKLALDAEESSAHMQKRLEEVNYLHDNVAEIPIDEFLEKYPKVKEQIEDDIKNSRWFV
jgi:ATP synthase D chain, mitochondrial (ATP5H)